MEQIDCEKLKQNRDDAYTQLVLVQIESKESSAKKGIFGFFNKDSKPDETASEIKPEDKDIQERLVAAQNKYNEAKRIYEENCGKTKS